MNYRFFIIIAIITIAFSCKRKEETTTSSTTDKTEITAPATTTANTASQQAKTTPASTAKEEEKPTAYKYAPQQDQWVFVDQKDGDTYTGDFIYMADAAVYFNCASGKKYPVFMRNDYITLEKSYSREMGENAGQRALVVFEGRPKQEKEDGQVTTGMIVTKTISVSKELTCKSYVHRVAAMYTEKDGSPTLTICGTNRTYKVKNNNLAAELSQKYTQLNKESIYVEFVGAPQSTEDNEGNYYVIIRLIGADATSTCKS